MAIVLINEIPTEVGSGADEILRLREELKVLYATNNNHVEVRVKLREELAAWKEGHTKEKLSAIEWAGKCQELQEQLATLKAELDKSTDRTRFCSTS
ncbi:MAG: hypothetical protein IPL32_17605 [Chloracidobacterium sp.]|nr:hypothetical protein [Chloracidobacterium sp.]